MKNLKFLFLMLLFVSATQAPLLAQKGDSPIVHFVTLPDGQVTNTILQPWDGEVDVLGTPIAARPGTQVWNNGRDSIILSLGDTHYTLERSAFAGFHAKDGGIILHRPVNAGRNDYSLDDIRLSQLREIYWNVNDMNYELLGYDPESRTLTLQDGNLKRVEFYCAVVNNYLLMQGDEAVGFQSFGFEIQPDYYLQWQGYEVTNKANRFAVYMTFAPEVHEQLRQVDSLQLTTNNGETKTYQLEDEGHFQSNGYPEYTFSFYPDGKMGKRQDVFIMMMDDGTTTILVDKDPNTNSKIEFVGDYLKLGEDGSIYLVNSTAKTTGILGGQIVAGLLFK